MSQTFSKGFFERLLTLLRFQRIWDYCELFKGTDVGKVMEASPWSQEVQMFCSPESLWTTNYVEQTLYILYYKGIYSYKGVLVFKVMLCSNWE